MPTTATPAYRAAKSRHPFHIDAWVVLPEHMHCRWALPEGAADFVLCWKVIKFAFARRLPRNEPLTPTQQLIQVLLDVLPSLKTGEDVNIWRIGSARKRSP